MINVPYVDKKNIEFIGFLCDTCDTFGKIEQHKTISFDPPIFRPSPHPRLSPLLSVYVCRKKSTVCRSRN